MSTRKPVATGKAVPGGVETLQQEIADLRRMKMELAELLGREMRRIESVITLAESNLGRATQPKEKPASPPKNVTLTIPPVKLIVLESDPRIITSLSHVADKAGIPMETASDFKQLASMLKRSPLKSCVPVVLLGADKDMDEAMNQMADLTLHFAHVPFIFACDVGISTVRRRALDAGASSFLEKPSSSAMQWSEQVHRFCEVAVRLTKEYHRRLSAQIEALTGN